MKTVLISHKMAHFTHAFKVFATLREGSGETARMCIRLANAFAECS